MSSLLGLRGFTLQDGRGGGGSIQLGTSLGRFFVGRYRGSRSNIVLCIMDTGFSFETFDFFRMVFRVDDGEGGVRGRVEDPCGPRSQ